jgi:ankyrin repeat protein
MRTTSRILLIAAVALLPMVATAADLATLIRDANRKESLAAIRAGADVNAAQPDGTTPLMWAVSRQDTAEDKQIVQELLQRAVLRWT